MTNTTENGLISTQSQHNVDTTVNRLEGLIAEKGMKLIAKVDHAAAAANIDQQLRPTVLLLFGNPAAGTPLMQDVQTAGIDLPQKYLVWQDAEDKVWITHNDPAHMAARHQNQNCQPLLDKVTAALAYIANTAAN